MAKPQPHRVTLVCDERTPRPIHPEEVELLLTHEAFVTLVLEQQDSKPQEETDARRTLR